MKSKFGEKFENLKRLRSWKPRLLFNDWLVSYMAAKEGGFVECLIVQGLCSCSDLATGLYTPDACWTI